MLTVESNRIVGVECLVQKYYQEESEVGRVEILDHAAKTNVLLRKKIAELKAKLQC